MKRLLSGAPGFQGQFRIVGFAEGVTDNEFARMIDQRHQLRFSPAVDGPARQDILSLCREYARSPGR